MTSNLEASSDNGVQDYMELPYHGNCQNCHHFHIGSIIRYFPNQRKSTKFSCENCGKAMFALGGNSTQTSLASILTISIEEDSPARDSTPPDEFRPCTNDVHEITRADRTPLASAPEDETSEQEPLPVVPSQTQIDNSSSLTGRDEGSMLPNGTITSISDTSNSSPIRPSQSSRPTAALPPEQTVGRQTTPQRFSPKAKAQKFLHFVRKRMPKRPQHPQNNSTQVALRVTPEMKDSSTMTEPPPKRLSRSGSSRILLPSSMPSSTHQVVSMDHIAHPDEELDGLENDAHIKKERLRAKRREATLRRSTLNARKCFCNDHCHCYRGAGRAAPQSHGSLNTSNVPDHHLGENLIADVQSAQDTSDPPPRHHSPIRRVAFIGAHLDDAEQFSDRPSSPSMLEARRPSRISSSTPTSQATTAIDSRSSEARLAIQSSRRSASLPALPAHDIIQVVEQSRPALLDYLRSLDPFGHPVPERNIRDMNGQESSSDSVSADVPETIPQFRTSTTSLSRLEVEDEETTPGPASSHRTPCGDSSSRTPQTNLMDTSNEPPPLDSDEIAEALEDLSCRTRHDTKVTDFGDRS